MSENIPLNIQKIGLVELANHNEVLRSYALTLLSHPNIRLSILTTSWIFEQCYDLHDKESIIWILSQEKQTSRHFLHENSSLLNTLDLIIQTTNVDAKGKLVKLRTLTPLALVVHDLHCNFNPLKHLQLSKEPPEMFKDVLRLILFLAFKKRLQRSLMRTAEYYFLPSQNVLAYAQSKYGENSKFKYFPFAINDEISKPLSRDKHIQITIPGNISKKSRDYQIVIDALMQINTSKLHINLLGKPSGLYGNQIIKRMKNISALSMKTYDSFVSQKEFDEIMRATDFLILPMNKIMKFGIVGELNGYSCTSGNINDMIRFGIPSIIPSYYPIPKELLPITETYNSPKSLADAITLWMDRSIINNIKEDKMEFAMRNFGKQRALNSLFSQLNLQEF